MRVFRAALVNIDMIAAPVGGRAGYNKHLLKRVIEAQTP